MQSSLGATLTLSIERIVATAVGASVGAVEAIIRIKSCRLHAGDLFIGLLRMAFVWRRRYRYASVTLTIIVLIRDKSAWIVASIDSLKFSRIIVALAVVAFWPERSAILARTRE